MHELIERFVGRFEVWRRSAPLRNPLNIPALVLAASIAPTLYHIVMAHHVDLWAATLLAVDIAFLALYLRRSPWAWLVLPVWGAMALIQLPFVVASNFHGYPSRVSVVVSFLLLVIGVGFIVWGFAIRGRYHAYIGYACSSSQP